MMDFAFILLNIFSYGKVPANSCRNNPLKNKRNRSKVTHSILACVLWNSEEVQLKRSVSVFLFALVTTALLSPPVPAAAFHEGGVGYCEGCHTLHPSPSGDGNGLPLLKRTDPSSTCLGCHAETSSLYNVLSSDGSSFTAGGDFYWLETAYAWTEEGDEKVSAGHKHGHNIVAVDYGLDEDSVLRAAPGGDYPSAALSCISCHDPHGKISDGENPAPISGSGSYGGDATGGAVLGNYRLLGGIGYAGGTTGGALFSNGAPVAVAPLPHNGPESDSNHVAYGSGMSEWCANCHADLLPAGGAGDGTKHPAGNSAKMTSNIADSYNAYVKSGDLTGVQTSAYLALVPFEVGTVDVTLLDPESQAGPEADANVMCLSCHRAHASAFADAGRWDFQATLLADSHPASSDTGASAGDVLNSYYGRDTASEFGPFQRQLCAKCHPCD